MKIAIVFDTPYPSWEHEDHLQEMESQVEAWAEDEPEAEYQIGDALRAQGHEIYFIGVGNDFEFMFERLERFQPDLCFNGAEAFGDEAALDYLFPAMLEARGYRHTGSPPLSLLLTRNKAMSKQVLAYHDVRVPSFRTYRLTEGVDGNPNLRFPVIIKPLQMDASVGISQASVVQDVDGLAERVKFIHGKFQQAAIAEEFIDGRELYIGILGNRDALQILPFTELIFDKDLTKPEERIATRYAKWDEPYRARKGIKNVFARPLAARTREVIEHTCLTAFQACWCYGYARLDVRITPEGDVWVIEINANPFISYGHDMANMADKAGLDYYQFIERIVEDAVARYGHTNT